MEAAKVAPYTPLICNAWVAKNPNQPLEKWTYEAQPLRDSDIQLRITHNGLCHTDLHMRDNDWKITSYPLIAGHEVVGVVEEVGSHVKHIKKGDRIAYGWVKDSCRQCCNCIKGEESICLKGYTGLIVGAGNHGGFQDRLRAPADFGYKLPNRLSSADAAPLLCAGITVYSPLSRYVTRPGMKVGVMGIGGLGHLAIQIAHHLGAEVTAFSTTSAKEEEARGFGAHRFVTYDPKAPAGTAYGVKSEDWVDILINCTPVRPEGGDYTDQLNLLNPDGVLVLTGIPPASEGTVSLLPLIFGQKKLAGSIVGGRAKMNEMLEFCAIHGIKPKIQVMKMSQINEALKLVLENKARYRYVLVPDEDVPVGIENCKI